MYKTVRHGENSLQYTILPQTEEVISNSGLKGKGRDYSPSIHVRRSHRTVASVLKSVLLVLGITATVALTVTVPFFILKSPFYHLHQRSHESQEIITNSPLTPTGREIVKTRKKELQVPDHLTQVASDPMINKVFSSSAPIVSSTTVTAAPSVPAVDKGTTPPWNMLALRSWKSSTSSTTVQPVTADIEKIPLIGTPSGSIRMLDRLKSPRPWEDVPVNPTVAPTAWTKPEATTRDLLKRLLSNMQKLRVSTTSQKPAETIRTTTATTVPAAVTVAVTTESPFKSLKDTMLSVDYDDELKESLEEDGVFSLPPLKPDPELPSDANEVTVSKTKVPWYGQRWPFVDTSSYFQWSGYNKGDNALLPLLASVILSILCLLMMFLFIRRVRKAHAESLNRVDTSDCIGDEDDATLLPKDNAGDAEE